MKRMILLLALVLLLVMAFAPMASAHDPVCGEDFGQFHRSLAQEEGPMGQVHKPGLAHNGAAGLCHQKDNVPHWDPH